MQIPDPLVGGVGYGPFQGSESPSGEYPTEAQMLADLTVLKGITDTIRTYGVQQNLRTIPALAEQVGLDVAPGAYLTATDHSQRDILIEVLNEGHSNIPFAVVGSEWAYEGLSAQNIIDEIDFVRAATPPDTVLTTAERAHVLLNLSADEREHLSKAADFLLVNISVYEDGLTVAQAVDDVVAQYRTVQAMYPDEKLVIGEIGWPTAGGDPDETNPEMQSLFFAEFAHRATVEQIPFFAFEAFDEPWKGLSTTDVPFGPHWGIFGADRMAKDGFTSFLPWANSTEGADSLDGGAGKDLIHGLAGDDTIAGHGDSDILWGGDGHDSLDGGDGDDLLDGGAGNDTVQGGGGDDGIAGSDGDDSLDGGDGDDLLGGGAGNDTVQGGDGDDALGGDAGDDTLIGGPGDDSLDGGAGNDLLIGDSPASGGSDGGAGAGAGDSSGDGAGAGGGSGDGADLAASIKIAFVGEDAD